MRVVERRPRELKKKMLVAGTLILDSKIVYLYPKVLTVDEIREVDTPDDGVYVMYTDGTSTPFYLTSGTRAPRFLVVEDD